MSTADPTTVFHREKSATPAASSPGVRQDRRQGIEPAATLGTLERDFVNRFQGGFPLTERPFQQVALELGTNELTLLSTIRRMLDGKLLSRFGPLFNAERLGGRFTLAAMEVPEPDFERTTHILNAVPEVAHNYRRDHRLNMWFVLATSSAGELQGAIGRIQSLTGLRVFDFPKLKEYHLGFWLQLDADGGVGVRRVERDKPAGPLELDDLDRTIIAATQAGYPLTPEPFAAIAAQIHCDAQTVIARLGRMLRTGAVRRIGAVPNHYRLGLRGNGMSVWNVNDEQVDILGAKVGALDFVTHCYRRPRHLPLWPYNLFAMVHGRDRDEVELAVSRIAGTLAGHCTGHQVLHSEAILKKTGLRFSR